MISHRPNRLGDISVNYGAVMAGMAAASAPTLGTALETLVRYERLMSTNSRGQSRIKHTEDGGLSAIFYSINPYNRYNCFVVDSILAGWVAFLRELDEQDPVPRHITIEYPEPPNADAYTRWFGCSVPFGAEQNRVDLTPATAARVNRLAQSALFQGLRAGYAVVAFGHCRARRFRKPERLPRGIPTMVRVQPRPVSAPVWYARLIQRSMPSSHSTSSSSSGRSARSSSS